jgi:hypothetical protein
LLCSRARTPAACVPERSEAGGAALDRAEYGAQDPCLTFNFIAFVDAVSNNNVD